MTADINSTTGTKKAIKIILKNKRKEKIKGI
jgi:hypothetical protein